MERNLRPENMTRITNAELAKAFIDEQVEAVRAQVGDKKVLLALSGGVDSSVVAALLIKAIGKQLVCVHVNHGLMRKDESENVIKVLDKLENGDFPSLEFIELNACPGGCVGGVLTIQNPFVAKARLRSLRRYLPVSENFVKDEEGYIPDYFLFDDLPNYHPISRLSDSMAESMRMLADIQHIKGDLPGLDCGSCGAPTCRAFAEDIVKGQSSIDKCLIKMCKDAGDKNDSK